MSFYTLVIEKDKRLTQLARCDDLGLLEPRTRMVCQSMLTELEEREPGRWTLWETFRSKNRQRKLFLSGKSKRDLIGVHAYGLAFDIVHLDARGRPTWKGDFSILGELAKEHKIIWGGSWPHLHDAVHLQRIAVADQKKLFDGSWYPDSDYVAAAPK
jgi:hypothetical protein